MSLGDMIDMDNRSWKREANKADFWLFISARCIIARMEQIGEMGTGVLFVVIPVERDGERQMQVRKAYKVNFSFAVDVVGDAYWKY